MCKTLDELEAIDNCTNCYSVGVEHCPDCDDSSGLIHRPLTDTEKKEVLIFLDAWKPELLLEGIVLSTGVKVRRKE